jgi:hypothetical protein
MTTWRDPLAVRPARQTRAEFGGEPRRITSLRTNSALNDRPRASLRLAALVDPPLDYLAELRISATAGPSDYVMFTGFVDSATPDGGEVRIEALSATELSEQTVGSLVTSGVPAPELVYLLARHAGYTDDRLRIQGIDSLPTEVFEVLVPVAGLELDEPLPVGGVTLLPARWEASPGPIPAAPFEHLALEPYACVAITFETAAKMLDAETAALSRIELALDGLLASTLYGFSIKPDGTYIPFARSTVRARPRRLSAVCVYGLGTDRIWVRDTDTHGMAVSVHAGLLNRRWQDLQLRPLPVAMRDMLAALRRAADETQSPVQRGQALWDVIEFLTAGVRVPKIFAKADRRAIRTALQGVSLTDQQRNRLDETLKYLNEPSLAMKMRARAAADGVPLSQSEIDLLKRLRDARNDSAHGRAPSAVSEHDLRWAVSVVARLIMYRWYRSVYSQTTEYEDTQAKPDS